MKDLWKLVRECKEELDALGIEYRTVRNWTVNTRSQRRWGQCKVVSSDVFDINISVRLLADQVSDTAAKDTIIHELLHTVEGCLKHTGKWKALAEKVNRAYPQYHIKRATTEEEKGFEKTARTYHSKLVSELIRHSSVSFTDDIYIHLKEKYKEQTVANFSI